MKSSFALLAVVAVIGLGVMAFASFDSSLTGQPIKIVKLPVKPQETPQIVKLPVKTQETEQFPIVKLPVKTPVYKTTSGSLDTCSCEDMYGGNIMTLKKGGQILAGLSAQDCSLYSELVKLRTELNLKTSQFGMVQTICENQGWWQD